MNFSIDQVSFAQKRVLIRVDFNVPLNEAREVTDDTRIRAALPTIKKVLNDGGAAILMSHLGRPKGADPELSMKHIAPKIAELLGVKVHVAPDCIGDDALAVTNSMNFGEVALLENLRFHKEETAGDEFFAGQLAEHGDVWINDAFGTAHRAHASTAVIARFFPHDKYLGYVMENEIFNVNKVLHGSEKPVLAIVGGAKVSSKIVILEQLISKVDHVLIGGGMAYTFIKAQGGNVGNSLVEDEHLGDALSIIKAAEDAGVKIHLPIDTKVADAFANDANTGVSSTGQIEEGWMGLDIGPKSIEYYSEVIQSCKTILWNGPMGVFEMSSFETGTKAVAQALVEATKNGAFTLIGGGDSVAAINKYGFADDVSYVSTGGGAMLEYLEGKVLPGIAAVAEE
ncbi:MAG: phosphoglycerate kinase [Flavobacteriales bacterium]|nr:phosphoglycerate kinase [Flavobacteriales bacterium]MDG1765509.1 phosphoglycerate kinase [Flavobacteriales bacterium]